MNTKGGCEHHEAARDHGVGVGLMSYDRFFADAIAQLRDERRNRVFADLERIAGSRTRFGTLRRAQATS